MAENVVLGSTVRDKITKFTGIATGRTTFLYGCVRIIVTPTSIKDKDSKPNEGAWFDEAQLDVIKGPDKNLIDNPKQVTEKPAGPRPDAPRHGH